MMVSSLVASPNGDVHQPSTRFVGLQNLSEAFAWRRPSAPKWIPDFMRHARPTSPQDWPANPSGAFLLLSHGSESDP